MHWLYVAVLAVAIAATLAFRWALSRVGPIDEGRLRALQLHEYEAAYLAGGRERAVGAAIGSLVYRNLLTADPGARTVTAVGEVPGMAHPLDKAIHYAASPGPERIDKVARAVDAETAEIEKALLSHGLLWSPDARVVIAVLTAGVFSAIVAGGVWAGVSATGYSPHQDLIVLALTIGIACLFSAPRRTSAGDHLATSLKQESEPVKMAVAHGGAGLTGSSIALAIGLFGHSVLDSTPLGYLGTLIAPRGNSSCGACGGCGGCGGCGCGGCA